MSDVGKETQYISLGASQMRDQQYIELSNSAKVIYTYMLLVAGGNPTFEFPQKEYKDLMNKHTFIKARDELINKGFIEIKENNANLRKANVYEFSKKWKAMQIPFRQSEQNADLKTLLFKETLDSFNIYHQTKTNLIESELLAVYAYSFFAVLHSFIGTAGLAEEYRNWKQKRGGKD